MKTPESHLSHIKAYMVPGRANLSWCVIWATQSQLLFVGNTSEFQEVMPGSAETLQWIDSSVCTDTRLWLEHAVLPLIYLQRSPKTKHTPVMATQAFIKSLRHIIDAITQTLRFVLPHHHSHGYKGNPSQICRKIRDITPCAPTNTKTFTDFYEVTVNQLAAYREIHLRNEWSSWLYKNIHLWACTERQHPGSLKNKVKTGDSVSLQKLKNKWHLL